MEGYVFKNDALQKEYEKRKEELLRLAEQPVNTTSYLWDRTVAKYAETMERVQNILCADGVKEYVTQKIMKNIKQFLCRCSDAEFHIALVGAIKAGKSTLINAMLGYEYASTKVTPETASLTKFKKADKNVVHISFYTREEWNQIWESAKKGGANIFLEEYQTLQAEGEKLKWLGSTPKEIVCGDKEALACEIEKWTSSKSPVHYFVKEVEVGLEDFELPEGVVLVDTPGLDDVVEYRSDITREYIDRANAVLVCVKSDTLTGPEMATIYSVFANTRYKPEKVYIIATQVDTLNRPVENWKEQRTEWLKYLKDGSAYGSYELAVRNLIPVSAYLYLLLKIYPDLEGEDERQWELRAILAKLRMKNLEENYQNVLDLTKIAYLKNRIRHEVVEKHKQILVEDIIASYRLCREEILEVLGKTKQAQEEMIRVSQESAEEIRKKHEEYSRKYKEAEEDKKELQHVVEQFRLLTQKRSQELENAIKGLKRG